MTTPRTLWPLLAALLSSGCLHFDTLEDTVSLETHARDWRD